MHKDEFNKKSGDILTMDSGCLGTGSVMVPWELTNTIVFRKGRKGIKMFFIRALRKYSSSFPKNLVFLKLALVLSPTPTCTLRFQE